jgi:hypothetical protein
MLRCLRRISLAPRLILRYAKTSCVWPDREFQESAHSPAVYTDPGSLVHAKLAEPPDPESNPCETQGRNCTASLSSRGSITSHRERPAARRLCAVVRRILHVVAKRAVRSSGNVQKSTIVHQSLALWLEEIKNGGGDLFRPLRLHGVASAIDFL